MVLSFLGPGDVLGELSFAHASPRSSNVIAIEPAEARALAASEFRGYLRRRPTAALTLLDVLSDRFRDADRKRVQFGASDTIGRVRSLTPFVGRSLFVPSPFESAPVVSLIGYPE